jgi:hypothetical protein
MNSTTFTEDEIVKAYSALGDGLMLVEDMIIAAKQALEMNPEPNDALRLNENIARLEEERHRLNAKKLAIINNSTIIKMPTAQQILEIADLRNEVAKLTAANAQASEALVVMGKALIFAQGIDFG